ncbi:unnamed protein product, partial [Polarella glacialis]
MAENRYQRAGALPDIRLGEPPRCDWLQNIRNAAPLLILLLTSCVCTFLVPALVSTGSARSSSGLVEVPQAQRTTTSLLDRLPISSSTSSTSARSSSGLVEVPQAQRTTTSLLDRLPITSSTSSTSSTSTLTLTLTSTLPQRPLTTGSTSSVSPASLPITIDLDVEMQVRGVDQNLLSNKPFLRQAFATSIHTTIARTIGVPPSSVVLHLPSGSSLTVRARVTPPDGETAGDLYAQVRDSRRALGAAVAKAISDTENIRSVVRGTIGVGGVEVWMVPSNEVEDNVDVVADVSKTYTATATATATTTTTTLAANLAEAATMVTRTDGDIPAFNGAAKGSLVAASGMAGAVSDSTVASFAAGGALGADLFLSSSNVVYNNLGGLGPGKGEPPELRYGGVCNVGGKPLDLSITVGGEHEYQPKLPTLNGMGSHKASVASINLALGSSVDLQMRFLRRDGLEQKAVRLHRVFVSIFDVDEPFRAISAPNEIFMSGFQAVLWPNGTSFVPPVGGVDAWAAPDGVAAVYVFTDVDAVRLRLRAVQNVGNALGNYAGRTFLISLNSPDAEPVHGAAHAKSLPAFNGAAKGSLVAASGMAGAMSDSTIASFAAGGGLGADLFLSSSNVVYNNLGGLGPGKGEPPELRYGGVCNVGGKPLDLSIIVGGEHEYQPKLPTLNGMGSHKASVASINLALGSSVDLQMRFLRGDGLEQKAVRLHRVFVSIFDVDEPFRAISAPDEVFMSGFQAVLWPNGTSFVPSVGGVDAWAAPDGVAAVYVFTDVDAVRLRLRAVQNVGNALGSYAGRTFLISLNSPDAEPVHGAVHAKSLPAFSGAAKGSLVAASGMAGAMSDSTI